MLKLPVVFQHFTEHQKENHQIGFIEFLDMHYMQDSPKDKDYQRDMQLPFKSTNDCITSIIYPAFIPVMMQPLQMELVEITSVKIFFLKDQSIQNSFLSNIWQPPKSC